MLGRLERRMLLDVPWGFIGVTAAIAALGVYNLVSASRPPNTPVWVAQAAYFVLGFVVMAVVSVIDIRVVQRLTVPFYVVNIGLLIALKFIGHRAKGAESWFVLGPVRFQPAELMKIAMVLMLAKYFHDDYRPNDSRYGFMRLIPPVLLAGVPTVLVLAQPDLGTAMMMGLTLLTVLLFARLKTSVWAVGVVAFGLVVGVIWNDYVRVQAEPRVTVVRQFLKKHQDGRISGWLDPTTDLKGTNYHSMQSKIAVGSGGLTGKGWKQGTQTGLRYLPEQHTDFIFSVWAEEHGFLACLLLLVLYGAFLTGALAVAFNARERFGVFVAVGLAAMVFWQIFENIGMVTGLLPVTGITLPLLSYGGSSVLSMMIAVGLLINISMRRTVF